MFLLLTSYVSPLTSYFLHCNYRKRNKVTQRAPKCYSCKGNAPQSDNPSALTAGRNPVIRPKFRP